MSKGRRIRNNSKNRNNPNPNPKVGNNMKISDVEKKLIKDFQNMWMAALQRAVPGIAEKVGREETLTFLHTIKENQPDWAISSTGLIRCVFDIPNPGRSGEISYQIIRNIALQMRDDIEKHPVFGRLDSSGKWNDDGSVKMTMTIPYTAQGYWQIEMNRRAAEQAQLPFYEKLRN